MLVGATVLFQIESLLFISILLFGLIQIAYSIMVFITFNNSYLGDKDLLFFTQKKESVTQLKYSNITVIKKGILGTLLIEGIQTRPLRICSFLYPKTALDKLLDYYFNSKSSL
jgi:hypothetical protein